MDRFNRDIQDTERHDSIELDFLNNDSQVLPTPERRRIGEWPTEQKALQYKKNARNIFR